MDFIDLFSDEGDTFRNYLVMSSSGSIHKEAEAPIFIVINLSRLAIDAQARVSGLTVFHEQIITSLTNNLAWSVAAFQVTVLTQMLNFACLTIHSIKFHLLCSRAVAWLRSSWMIKWLWCGIQPQTRIYWTSINLYLLLAVLPGSNRPKLPIDGHMS